MQAYTPISCSYYDHLEAIATTKKVCSIIYRVLEEDHTATYAGVIVDLYARNKEEFMVLDNGLTIRLDHLASMNDIPNPSYAFHQQQDASGKS